jgi:hypothetical protein
MKTASDLVSTATAASLLGVTPGHVYYLVQHGKLKRARKSANIFSLSDVLLLRAQRRQRRRARPTVGDQLERVLQGAPA